MLSCIDADIYNKVSIYCTAQAQKNKPVGPVAESPSWLVSASVDAEEDGEAIDLLPSDKRETFYYMIACLI